MKAKSMRRDLESWDSCEEVVCYLIPMMEIYRTYRSSTGQAFITLSTKKQYMFII